MGLVLSCSQVDTGLVRCLSVPCCTMPSADPAMRRAVVVLPFISMVTEKTKHLQRIVAPYNRGRPKRQRIKASRNKSKTPTRYLRKPTERRIRVHVTLLACQHL